MRRVTSTLLLAEFPLALCNAPHIWDDNGCRQGTRGSTVSVATMRGVGGRLRKTGANKGGDDWQGGTYHRRRSQLIKVLLVCDTCEAVIADGISANEVRFQAEALYRRRDGKDLCLTCAGDAPTVPWPFRKPRKAPGRRRRP